MSTLEARTIDAASPRVAAPAARDRRIKVLYVITSTAGGVGLNAYDVARFLDPRTFDLTVAYGPGYPMDEPIEAVGIPVVHLRFSRGLAPFTNVRGLMQLHRLIRRERYDLVLSACSIAGMAARLVGWALGVPCTLFSAQLWASHPQQSWPKRFMYGAIERWLDRFTTHYIAVSEAARQFGIARGITSADKITTIHNSIATDEYERPRADAALRASFGLRPDSRVVGTALRFEPQKGVAYFLEAAAALHSRYPDVEFLVAGDGPLKERLHEQARKLGIFDVTRFVGWRTDIPELLAVMDVFCHATLWEQFPYMVLQALALETPTVATAVDGVPEMLLDEETGLLVPPRDGAKLAAAVERLLDAPEWGRQLARAGRQKVLREFDAREMVRRYEALFERLVAVPAPAEVVR